MSSIKTTPGAWLGSFDAATVQFRPDTKRLSSFLALQNFLSDKKLMSREDCKNRVQEFYANSDQYSCERGIMELPLKWSKIVEQKDACNP